MSLFSIPLHPSLVHFPIAMLFLGATLALVYEWTHYPALRNWGFISMLLGWILTIPAIVTGLVDKSAIEIDSQANQIADQHTTAIFIMWGLYGLALYWQYRWQADPVWDKRRWQWMILVILASLVLLFAGHLGGRLVYEMGVAVQAQ